MHLDVLKYIVFGVYTCGVVRMPIPRKAPVRCKHSIDSASSNVEILSHKSF